MCTDSRSQQEVGTEQREKVLEAVSYAHTHGLFLNEEQSGGNFRGQENSRQLSKSCEGNRKRLPGASCDNTWGPTRATQVPHPGIPLVEGLDVDEGHFPIGSGHDTVMLTADNQVDVVPQLPPAVTAMKKGLIWSLRS